jgi:hypothetical protein
MKGYSGGTIGYGIDAPPTPHSSPAVITAYENQTLNLEAYDNQVHINGKEFEFLDDEANDNESKWGYTTDDNFSKNKNYSRVLKSSDNGLTLKAFLRQKCYPTFQNSFIDNGQAGEIFVNNTLRTSPYNSDLVYEGNTITASSSTQIINGINFSFSRWEDNLTTNYRTFTIEDNETHTIYYTGKPSNYNRDVTFGTVLWDPIKVEWVDNVNTNVTYYQIWRKINGGTPVLVGSVNRGVQQFIDPDYYLANWKQFDRVEYDPRPYYSIEGTSATPLFVEIYGIQLKESEENQITEKKNIPTEFTITNYPNPFNPTTTINYQLPITSNVVIKVFDITGKEVAVLVNEKKEAGYYNINFDGGNLSSGIYIYSVQANENRISKKMLLVK